jgi:hypothetical protein
MENRLDNYRRFGIYTLGTTVGKLTIFILITVFPRFRNYDSETTNPRFGN